MTPVEPTVAQAQHWGDPNTMKFAVIGGPEEGPDVIPCPTLITQPLPEEAANGATAPIMRVAYKLDEIELTHLARGGTLWLSTYGSLPIHLLSVQPPAGAPT